MTKGLSIALSESYHNKCFYTQIFFKNLNIILIENWQGIKPMGLSASLADYKNEKYFLNMKSSPTTFI